MKQKTCIIICGPTASGKTPTAIQIATLFNTQIISADSRQCYKELGVAVAKPTLDELVQVRHHFINTHSIFDDFSAADFENYALKRVNEIFKTNDIAVMVGGTGLYIKAFSEGLDDIKPIPQDIKINIASNYQEHGLAWLQNTIEKEDKLFFEIGEMKNPHRIIRALEVIRSTGKSILEHQQKIKKIRNFNIVKIGIDVDRNELYDRINNRVDAMLQNGLVAEAKELFVHKHLNALQTVGYRELFDAFENKTTIEKAIELIKQNTRHYAKRQLTWFKKDEDVQWLKSESILNFVKNIFPQ